MCRPSQAATALPTLGTGFPSSNLLRSHTSRGSSGALSFPNRFSATIKSRRMSAAALSTLLNRFAAVVGSRTGANGRSTTLVVRRCRQ